MKFPFNAPQNNPKPVFCNSSRVSPGGDGGGAVAAPYEPTSVLDLGRSPSPAAAPSAVDVAVLTDLLSVSDDAPPLHWDDHMFHSLDGWDFSLMLDLGLHEDSATKLGHGDTQTQNLSDLQTSQLVSLDFNQSANHNLNSFEFYDDFHHHHSGNSWNFGFEFLNELVQLAECFESNELQLAEAILARLNQRLRSPIGKPLQRAAFYFKEALQSLLAGSDRTVHLSSLEIVQTIKAYKAFSGTTPIAMFSNFTANQALLEALDGSSFIHVIDFDIGLGGQWSSFMKEIADRSDSFRSNPAVLRITAIVPEEYSIEARLIRDNLCQFAREVKIRFHIDFVLSRTFEVLSFKSIKFMEGEKTAFHLSPTIFRRLGDANRVSNFLCDLRRFSPAVVVFVDTEGWTDAITASSFSRRIIDGLEFYSALLESLDAANAGGGDWIRKIETYLLRPKILAAVESGGRRFVPCREIFSGAGFRPVALSQFSDCQAECLLRTAQVKGFHVAKRHSEMLLCWHERSLVATSAWR